MCRRFFIDIAEEVFLAAIAEAERKLREAALEIEIDKGMISPKNIAPIKTNEQGFMAMRWGFKHWDGKSDVLYNARSETATTSAFWKRHVKNRCVIPASCFFEPDARRRNRALSEYRMPDKIIYMAGIYTFENDEDVPRFTILTKNPPSHLLLIHDRIPVVLPENRIDDWFTDFDAVKLADDKAILAH